MAVGSIPTLSSSQWLSIANRTICHRRDSLSLTNHVSVTKPQTTSFSLSLSHAAFTTRSIRKGKGGDEVSISEADDEEEWGNGDLEGLDGQETTTFDQMRKWLQTRPEGFGEGKAYDLSLEEELMEEIAVSRKAHLINISNLKNANDKSVRSVEEASPKNLPKTTTTVAQPKMKDIPLPPGGVRVRVGNLPKKRNIQRDLQLAFKAFPGIIKIHPAITGSKKTRDPVCKGFAFLDLASQKAAERFVKAHSKQSFLFGKVQKQITCHIISIGDASTNFDSERKSNVSAASRKLLKKDTTEAKCLKSDQKNYGHIVSSQSQDNLPISSSSFVTIAETTVGTDATTMFNFEDTLTLSSTNVQKKPPPAHKRKSKKTKRHITTNSKVPGSASRLKFKERNILTGVFSKYGQKQKTTVSAK